jgi:4-carboxymuconolactone decarboxylase
MAPNHPDRLPAVAPERMSEAQREASAEFAAERGTAVFGPFVPLLRSPELMLRAARLGEYLRSRSALGPRLGEFAILCISRRWTQQVEWAIHAPLALKAGVGAETVAALAEGARPASMAEDEALIHDALEELHSTRGLCDATFAHAVSRLGEQGLVDLLGFAGYYTLMAMVLNAARTPAPGGPAPLPPFPR